MSAILDASSGAVTPEVAYECQSTTWPLYFRSFMSGFRFDSSGIALISSCSGLRYCPESRPRLISS